MKIPGFLIDLSEQVGKKLISKKTLLRSVGDIDNLKSLYSGVVRYRPDLNIFIEHLPQDMKQLISKKVDLEFQVKTPQGKKVLATKNKKLDEINKKIQDKLSKASESDVKVAQEYEKHLRQSGENEIYNLRQSDQYKPVRQAYRKTGAYALTGAVATPAVLGAGFGLYNWFGNNDNVQAQNVNQVATQQSQNQKQPKKQQPRNTQAADTTQVQPTDTTQVQKDDQGTNQQQNSNNINYQPTNIDSILNDLDIQDENVKKAIQDGKYVIDSTGQLWINVDENTDKNAKTKYKYEGDPSNKYYGEYLITNSKDNLKDGNLKENHSNLENDPMKGSAMYNFICDKLIEDKFITDKKQLNIYTVKKIQQSLNNLFKDNNIEAELTPDGILGPDTYKAIKAAQEANYSYDDLISMNTNS